MNKKTSIGGSALIEGVMMRGPLVTAMAVRHVSGEIRTEQWNEDTTKRPLILKIPIVRGVYAFISSLALSYKCLMKSAAMSGLEEEDDGKTAAKPDAMPVKNAQAEDNTQAQSGGGTPEGNNAPTEDAAPRQNALANPEGGAESGVSQEDVLSESGASIQENTVSMESRVETAPAAPSASPAAVTAAEAAAKKEKESKLYTLLLALAVAVGTVLGTALAVGLFIFVPVMLSGLIPFLKDNYIPRAVFEGMVRLVV
ncbi:MAG: hypothetical protein FWF49_00675, partial [Oscillospiraceae bacterium]|nr:hypothetical protein [Oscillospiraceae bacterium]